MFLSKTQNVRAEMKNLENDKLQSIVADNTREELHCGKERMSHLQTLSSYGHMEHV